VKRTLIALLLLALSGRPAAPASGFAGEFLALGAGARALALGGAYVALADDATASYWNPAGLTRVADRQLHLMHAERYGGMVSHDVLALAGAGNGHRGMGLSLIRIGVADIPFTELEDPTQPLGTTNRPVVVSTESSADYALYVSYARQLRSRLDLGISAKGIYRTVGPYSAYGAGLDLGVFLRLHRCVSVAAVLRDVTTTPIHWDTETTDRIQPSLVAGLAFTRSLAGGRMTALAAARGGGDAASADDASPLLVGLEYSYRHVALRAGLEEGRQSLGIGLRLHARLQLDLAYAQHDDLDSIQQVSAGFQF
jgi:hypothetical protein